MTHNATQFVRARIEPMIKSQAEHVLQEMGITPSQAVRMLYSYLATHNKWPFPLKAPNQLTQKVLRETDRGIDLNACKDAEDFFHQLAIDDPKQ